MSACGLRPRRLRAPASIPLSKHMIFLSGHRGGKAVAELAKGSVQYVWHEPNPHGCYLGVFFPSGKGLVGNGPVGERYGYLFLKAHTGTYQGFRTKIKGGEGNSC